jgi:hypothetical protein
LGPHERDEHAGKLADDLQGVLDAVGRQHYARSTARDFAKGGKYNPRPRRRYAIT